MTGEAALSEREIFKFAVQLPAQQRAAYLDQVCGDNRVLREEIESLVNAHNTSNSFMERPALELPADGYEGITDYQPLAERPGTIIGSYKLLEQIGEGGFGVVFMAEQERPVRRRVALKIIKPGKR